MDTNVRTTEQRPAFDASRMMRGEALPSTRVSIDDPWYGRVTNLLRNAVTDGLMTRHQARHASVAYFPQKDGVLLCAAAFHADHDRVLAVASSVPAGHWEAIEA